MWIMFDDNSINAKLVTSIFYKDGFTWVRMCDGLEYKICEGVKVEELFYLINDTPENIMMTCKYISKELNKKKKKVKLK